MSESCPAPSELAALAAGGLEDAIAEPLRAHIDVCSDCAMAVALAAQSDDASAPEARPGDTIADRYRLEAKVGSGAMAVVWAATDLRLERRVALKLVRAASGADAEAMARRLVRESKAMARLRHPNVITVHDAGSLADGGVHRDWSSSTASISGAGSGDRRGVATRSSTCCAMQGGDSPPRTMPGSCTATSSRTTCSSIAAGWAWSATSGSCTSRARIRPR